MIGYSTTQEAYKLLDANIGKMVFSRDKVFEENSSGRIHAEFPLDEAIKKNNFINLHRTMLQRSTEIIKKVFYLNVILAFQFLL